MCVKKWLLGAEGGERCCVIGTLFKSMELKPNILKDISSKVSLPHLFFTLIRCEQIDIVCNV